MGGLEVAQEALLGLLSFRKGRTLPVIVYREVKSLAVCSHPLLTLLVRGPTLCTHMAGIIKLHKVTLVRRLLGMHRVDLHFAEATQVLVRIRLHALVDIGHVHFPEFRLTSQVYVVLVVVLARSQPVIIQFFGLGAHWHQKRCGVGAVSWPLVAVHALIIAQDVLCIS